MKSLADPHHVLIVSNPSAGSRHRTDVLAGLVAALESRGFTTEFVRELDSLGPRVAALQESGQLRVVIAAGGDGTVAEVANRTTSTTPIAVFPLGTANLLAGYFGISNEAQQMAALVEQRTLVRLDAGSANGRLFLLMVGCGLDAEVVHRMHRRRRGKHINYFSWLFPAFSAFRHYDYPKLQITYQHPLPENSDPAQGRESRPLPRDADSSNQAELQTMPLARWAFAVNMPVYAAGLKMAPHARGDDGLLDICTFRHGSLWHGLKYIGRILLQNHQRLSDYASETAVRIRIESDEPVPYQLDGDPGGMLPLEIQVIPQRLTLLAPASRAEALGLKLVNAQSVGA